MKWWRVGMAEASTLSTVAEGLLIGAGAGIVSAIILGGFQWSRMHITRRRQVAHLRRLIIEDFIKIRDDAGLPAGPGAPQGIEAGGLRTTYYESFVRDLRSASHHRTNSLSADQAADLHHAIASADSFENFVRIGVETAAQERGEQFHRRPGLGLPVEIGFYQNVYRMFAEIKWLRLPDDMVDIEP